MNEEQKSGRQEGRLEALVGREAELETELSKVRAAINAEKLQLIELEHGVRVGSTVVDKKGVEYLVTRVDACWSPPWLEGNPRRKDGSFGTASRNLYSDWKLLTPLELPVGAVKEEGTPRIDVIGQNGNEGLHYTEADAGPTPLRGRNLGDRSRT